MYGLFLDRLHFHYPLPHPEFFFLNVNFIYYDSFCYVLSINGRYMYENIYLIYGKQLFLRQLRNARELGPCKITVLYCNLQLSRNLFIPPKFDHLDYLSIYFFLLIIFPRFGGIFFFFCNNSFKSDFPYKGRISHDIV